VSGAAGQFRDGGYPLHVEKNSGVPSAPPNRDPHSTVLRYLARGRVPLLLRLVVSGRVTGFGLAG
jgi:hypothetical protein